MRPRQTITESFSSFVEFEQDIFKAWSTDRKLERNVEKIISKYAAAPNLENFLALYWHQLWSVERSFFAGEHLAAYVQEVCYWAAYKTQGNLNSSQYRLSDCFQMAIAQLPIVLNGFDSKFGSNLKNYAAITFRSLLINSLRNGYEADLCSDWGLLRKITQKRLETALGEYGFSQEKIGECVLAWTCYKTIFAPVKGSGIKQLSKPDLTTWEQIADLYNVLRLQQLGANSAEYKATVLENRLQDCSRILRRHLCPQVDSLNKPKQGLIGKEIIDDLGSPGDSVLTEIIEIEESKLRLEKQVELQAFLTETLTLLKPELHKVLTLYYIEGLTQAEIAQQLEIKQYNISRNLAKARETMLKALGKWSAQKFQISLNTETMGQMNKILEEWLENYYKQYVKVR